MAGRCAPISPEEARQILLSLPGRRSLAQLRKELIRRGHVVSMTTLRKWKASAWTRKGGATKPAWAREAGKALEQCGLSDDVVADIEKRLRAASVGELGTANMSALLINAVLLLEYAAAALPELIQRDARGLAVLYQVAGHMVRGGVALMRESRALSERAMRERLRVTGGLT
jgi:hypothetical protein